MTIVSNNPNTFIESLHSFYKGLIEGKEIIWIKNQAKNALADLREKAFKNLTALLDTRVRRYERDEIQNVDVATFESKLNRIPHTGLRYAIETYVLTKFMRNKDPLLMSIAREELKEEIYRTIPDSFFVQNRQKELEMRIEGMKRLNPHCTDGLIHQLDINQPNFLRDRG